MSRPSTGPRACSTGSSRFENNHISAALFHWVLWRMGTPLSRCRQHTAWAGNQRDDVANASLAAAIRTLSLSDKMLYTYGYVREYHRGKAQQGLIICDRCLHLEHVPKFYLPGDALRLRGRLLRPKRQVLLFISGLGPSVLGRRIVPTPDGHFDLKVPLPEEPWRHFVQIVERERRPPGTRAPGGTRAWPGSRSTSPSTSPHSWTR